MITGSANATRPNSPPNVQASRVARHGVVDEEPLDDGAGDGEQHEEEGEAVAALLFGELLGPERTESGARQVGEAHPGAHEEAGPASAAGYATVFCAAVFARLARVRPPRPEVFRAREVDLVLVAMPTTLLRAPVIGAVTRARVA